MPLARSRYPLAYAQLASVTTSASEAGAQVHTSSITIMPAQFWYACWYSGIDGGKSGGAVLVACALAGGTRNSGTQASAPAAAAPAIKARRDGPAGRREGAADRGDPAGRRSWRGCIGSPSGRWGSAGAGDPERMAGDGPDEPEAPRAGHRLNQALAWYGS